MKQYINLLKEIKEKGTNKPAARAGMPGSKSLFGYQFRHNLADGFPLLTTKALAFKNIVVELLWFLRGDTNIKYLIDNGCNIWNQDAYNYYVKIASANLGSEAASIYHDNGDGTARMFYYEEFIEIIKHSKEGIENYTDHYALGDCGYQYGKVWRKFGVKYYNDMNGEKCEWTGAVDQIANLIKGLKETPEGRRHLVTALDPAHDTDLALYWCHCLMQFNCRPIETTQRLCIWEDRNGGTMHPDNQTDEFCDKYNIPKYYLDCQLYQRSADVFLGVPFNIASYALLTEILSKICNMIPGEFIHSFGDVHIYDNHIEQVELQLTRELVGLPCLMFNSYWEGMIKEVENVDDLFKKTDHESFWITNYDPAPAIKGKLSTGLK